MKLKRLIIAPSFQQYEHFLYQNALDSKNCVMVWRDDHLHGRDRTSQVTVVNWHLMSAEKRNIVLKAEERFNRVERVTT